MNSDDDADPLTEDRKTQFEIAMVEKTLESTSTSHVDASMWCAELSLEVRQYLLALYEAAGLPPPELTDQEVHAALQRTLEKICLPAAEPHGLLPWLTGLPSQALAHVQEMWTAWSQRARTTHEVVGEGLKQAFDTVQRVASDKLTALEARYGRTGAILVFTAAVVLTPVPVPGTTFAPVLLAEGIRAVGTTFWSAEKAVAPTNLGNSTQTGTSRLS
jgi:hypothetical protein